VDVVPTSAPVRPPKRIEARLRLGIGMDQPKIGALLALTLSFPKIVTWTIVG